MLPIKNATLIEYFHPILVISQETVASILQKISKHW